MQPNRRDMLTAMLSTFLVGCRTDDLATGTDSGEESCSDALDVAAFDGTLPFIGEPERALEVVTDDGLDRRYVVDLSTLDESTLILPAERFYIRTGQPDLIETANWAIDVRGLANASSFLLDDHSDLVEDTGPIYLECSGNSSNGGFGLMSAAQFSGIPLAALFDRLDIDPAATRVRIEGFDEHSQASSGSQEGAAWVFELADLADGWLVTHMNGEPLRPDHGFPVRLLVPQWWGCANIKWVNALVFTDENEPATSQMQEFATRTHQSGTPSLARDHIPAVRDPTAAPVRIERWVDGDRVLHRIIGVYWGPEVDERMWQIRIGGGNWEALTFCVRRTSEDTWGLWEKVSEGLSGDLLIEMRLSDDTIRTRRLDSGWYARTGRFT